MIVIITFIIILYYRITLRERTRALWMKCPFVSASFASVLNRAWTLTWGEKTRTLWCINPLPRPAGVVLGSRFQTASTARQGWVQRKRYLRRILRLFIKFFFISSVAGLIFFFFEFGLFFLSRRRNDLICTSCLISAHHCSSSGQSNCFFGSVFAKTKLDTTSFSLGEHAVTYAI